MRTRMVGVTGSMDGMVFGVEPGTMLTQKTARVSRSATLDGGCVITHGGYVAGDQTYSVKAMLTEAQAVQLTDILELGTELGLSTVDGYFLGAVDYWKNESGKLTMNFLISEQEA